MMNRRELLGAVGGAAVVSGFSRTLEAQRGGPPGGVPAPMPWVEAPPLAPADTTRFFPGF